MQDLIIFLAIIIFLRFMLRQYRTTNYNAYIHSPEWRRMRQSVLARDLYQCTECHSREHLHVHHKTYKNFGHEHLNELQTLCSSCHARKHHK